MDTAKLTLLGVLYESGGATCGARTVQTYKERPVDYHSGQPRQVLLLQKVAQLWQAVVVSTRAHERTYP